MTLSLSHTHTHTHRFNVISVWIDFYTQVVTLLHTCIIEERALWQCDEEIEIVTSNCLKLLDCRRLVSQGMDIVLIHFSSTYS